MLLINTIYRKGGYYRHCRYKRSDKIKLYLQSVVTIKQRTPFELNEDEFDSPIFDHDPDLQYFNDSTYLQNIRQCDYFLENTFIKKCEELSINNECLSFIHVNIRSIPKNLCSFLHYIDMLNLNFTVMYVRNLALRC